MAVGSLHGGADERALTTLAHCRKNVSGLGDFLSAQAALPQCKGLQLESFLIKPVQRLTKYPLFWKDMLKAVPHTHPQRAQLEKADELVRTVSMAVNQTLSDEVARLKTVQVLKDLGQEYMELIAPHRKLALEFTGVLHLGVRSWNAQGYVLTDLLIICQQERRNRRTPWLLSELKDVVVNQELALEEVALTLDERSAMPSAAVGFGLQPPAHVPRSRLLNLRLREREGYPVGEEYWLELEDESRAYELGDVIPSLGAESRKSKRNIQDSGSPRPDAAVYLAARLRDARLAKLRRAAGGGGGGRISSARPSRAQRQSQLAERSFAERSVMGGANGAPSASSAGRDTERGSSGRTTSSGSAGDRSGKARETPDAKHRTSTITTWAM